MWWRLAQLLSLWVSVVCLTVPAEAKKVALVVGIDTYDNLPKDEQLEKARNDAVAVGTALEGLDFKVILGQDLTRREFNGKLLELQNNLAPGDVAFIFYAGHGVEVDGQNYLLPRDIPKFAAGQEKLLPDEAIALSKILDALAERGTQVNLLVLDACRDNPFAATEARGAGGSRGLSRVDPTNGTFVMFSAGAKQVAFDRLPARDANDPPDQSPNSVFTRNLLPLLKRKGMSIQDMAKDVQEQVTALAGSRNVRQTPAYYDQITGRFYLNPADNQAEREIASDATTPTPAADKPPSPSPSGTPTSTEAERKVAAATPSPEPAGAKPAPPQPALPSREEEGELRYYDCIQENSPDCYRAFLREHADHPRADQIRKVMEAQIERPKYEACNQATNPIEQFRACDHYITLFKEGRFARQVNDILTALEAQKKVAALPAVEPDPPSPSPPPLAEAGRNFVQYDGYDVPGEDYGNPLKGISRGDCQLACGNDTRCNAFTYDRRNNWCFLKSGAPRLEANGNALSGISAAVSQPSFAAAGARDFIAYDGYDIPGGDYGGVGKNISLDRCRASCRDDPRCDAYTFDKKARWCFRKAGVSARAPNPRAISGVIASPSRSNGTQQAGSAGAGLQMLRDTDFTGMDLEPRGIRPTSLDECQRVCLGNPRCKAFSWAQASRWCWPKHGVPRPRNRSGVISGFRN